MPSIIHPMHYLIVEKQNTAWHFIFDPCVFYNPRNCPTPKTLDDLLHRFRLTIEKVVIEFFRISAGREGYYLANLRDQKYYYCGDSWESVQGNLLDLGVGKSESTK